MMAGLSSNSEKRKTFLGAAFVFVMTLTPYLLTVAPTVSFWDCGEFISCSYILGIPHPPGSQPVVLLGRLFTLIPLFSQIAFRTNLMSSIFSAATSALMFLTIFKLLSRWKISGFAKYLGALVAGLFLGYSYTFWDCAVETEVYAVAMFLTLLMVYLVLIWMDHKHTPKGDRILVLTGYLALYSAGVHMTCYLVVPILFLLVIWDDPDRLKDFRFWGVGLALVLITFASTKVFLGAMVGWLIISIVGTVNSGYARSWFLAAAIMTASVVGYSNQIYVPIRSTLNPDIDENDPNTWRRFTYFVERKQYGNELMVTRAMTRRGTWANEFGNHERIGFWRFFKDQYMPVKLWFIPVGLGIYGLYELIRRRPREGITFLLFFLISSAGLVWYMNFSDGSKGDRLEVRDRDYFFTPAFLFFAGFLGMGAAGLVSKTEESLSKSEKRFLTKAPAYALGTVFLLLPSLALSNNFQRVNRHGNWIPWDYAYNLLNSCEKDAIMFTNGDNDTFPLWFMQEVERIRRDVRIVNLSLLNTDWYIMQLKHKMGVPITLEDKQILWEPFEVWMGGEKRTIERPVEPYFDPVRNMTHYLYPIPDTIYGRGVITQDLMIEHIIRANNWKYPIYFSATVSTSNRVRLDNHLMIQGYAYKVVPQQGSQMVDTTYTYKKIMPGPEGEGKYRGLADENVSKDENEVGLLINYPEKFIELAGFYQMAGDTTKAIGILETSRKTYPDYWRTYAVLLTMYDWKKMPDEKDRVTKQGISRMKLMAEKYPDVPEYPQYLGLFYQFINEQILAIDYLQRSFEISPSDFVTYQSLLSSYMRQNRVEDMRVLAEKWLEDHPNEQNTLNLLRQLGRSQPLVQ